MTSRVENLWFEVSGMTSSGSEAGSYLRLIDLCVSLNSRLASNKEEGYDLEGRKLGGERFGFRV